MISIGEVNIPVDEIEYSNKEMKLRVNNSEFESGELIMTKREIAWKKDGTDSQGFSIPWNKIVVQAISNEVQRSIYFMINCLWPNGQIPPQNQPESNGASSNGNHSENEEDNEEFIDCDEESDITEFWMVPNNADEVDNIYYIMTRYPEAEHMDDSEDSDNDDFLDGEDIGQMNINDERFADD